VEKQLKMEEEEKEAANQTTRHQFVIHPVPTPADSEFLDVKA
jgi:hypothetical protein